MCGLSTSAGNLFTFFRQCNNRPVWVNDRAGKRPEIMVFVAYKNPKLFPVNLILTAVSRYTPINTSPIYNRTQALFAAQMTHDTAS